MTVKLSKAEQRQERQKEKQVQLEQYKAKIAQILPPKKTLKIAPIADLDLKVVKSVIEPQRNKSMYIPTVSDASIDCNLTWCTTHSDLEGNWSWNEPRLWTADEWNQTISAKFSDLENRTWYEIQYTLRVPAKGGKHVPLHHSQEIHTLIDEAKDRWTYLNLDDFETAFRFRFGGKLRAWGIKLQAHFFLVWWEREHKIYHVEN